MPLIGRYKWTTKKSIIEKKIFRGHKQRFFDFGIEKSSFLWDLGYFCFYSNFILAYIRQVFDNQQF